MNNQPSSASASVERRRFLTGVAAVAGAAALAQLPVGPAEATPRPADGEYSFKLGVAIGDPILRAGG
jgi:alkaline phosphatase D